MSVWKNKAKVLSVANSIALTIAVLPKVVHADGDGFITFGDDGKITFSPTNFDNSSLSNAASSSSGDIVNNSNISQADQQTYINIAIGIAIIVLLLAFIRNCVLLARSGNNKVNLERVKQNIGYNALSIALLGGFWSCFWLFHGLFR